MARVVVLGSGVSGHTAASFLRRWLPKKHQVTVVAPLPDYNWIPSNIWVGVGRMKRQQVTFPLKPVYDHFGIEFIQARATQIHPEGSELQASAFVVAESSESATTGNRIEIPYDFLVNATGPLLNFKATPGLGPDGNTLSVCTANHAVDTAARFLETVEQMKKGEKKKFVIGTGHGTCTCQGAALEYIVNLEFELRRHGVRDKAEVLWISNEYELGDLGIGGLHLKQGGYITHSKTFTESLFAERGIHWLTRTHISEVQADKLQCEFLDGSLGEESYDFAMLLPPFRGAGLQAFNRSGEDITEKLFTAAGFMKVDADYTVKNFEEWTAQDWPRTYQSPTYDNIYSVGIAFAPPHPISRPQKNPRGTVISPAPPRTGMPSAMMAKAVAKTITDRVRGRERPAWTASMTEMGAACVASAGTGLFNGSAASITVFPIVPDFDRYPDYGRDLDKTFGEIGLAGHWIKSLLHYAFLYKAKLKPGWFFIPE